MSSHALPTRRAGAGLSLVQAQPWQRFPVTLDSAAVSVMTDLSRIKTAFVDTAASLRRAETTMLYQGVRMLAVSSEPPKVDGIVTLDDLRGERVASLLAQGRRRDQITVAAVMTPSAELDALDFAQLQGARVGQLLQTLQELGRDHLVVVDGGVTAGVPARLRGIVSRTQIERQLGGVPTFDPVASLVGEMPRTAG